MSSTHCPHCGKEVQPFAPACWLCGERLSRGGANNQPRSDAAKTIGTIVLTLCAVMFAGFIALYTLCLVTIR